MRRTRRASTGFQIAEFDREIVVDGFQLDFASLASNYSGVARVVLENATKTFFGSNGQAIRAVNRANLIVEDKELLTLVGPSGCGKTTTLRLIAGLEELTEGNISIAAKLVNQVPPKDRDVAMVFQNHALYPHMTAYENIAFGLKVRRFPKSEIAQRVEATAKLLSLNDCLDRRPGEISGGQRQRVAVGRALVRRPQVLLLDEPFANLDAPLRRELRRELLRLHRELGLTILLVTHDQAEALALGQRVAVMNAGAIEQVGEPAELRARPVTAFVSAFLEPSPL
jgi:multiple sugar transport system ATP-binding protein